MWMDLDRYVRNKSEIEGQILYINVYMWNTYVHIYIYTHTHTHTHTYGMGSGDSIHSTAERRYPRSEVRSSGRERQPHVEGVVAAQAQEGLEELFHIQGKEGWQ